MGLILDFPAVLLAWYQHQTCEVLVFGYGGHGGFWGGVAGRAVVEDGRRTPSPIPDSRRVRASRIMATNPLDPH
eukprot:285892-Pelagomonas_calceolata.AAC.4